MNLSESIPDTARQRVLLDRGLAAIYGVNTGWLNEAVKRNEFQLTVEEAEILRSQFAISSWVAVAIGPSFSLNTGAANVLRSARAVEMIVVRAFVQLREMLASNKELAQAHVCLF